MNTAQDIEGFLGEKIWAVAGVSRDPRSFSARAYVELKGKGHQLYPVNPNAQIIDGDNCYPSLGALPEQVGGVLVFTAPGVTAKVVREAADAGIRRIWMQQGAEDDESIRICEEEGLEAVSKQCIMMFAEPVAPFHAFHRWVKKLFGGIPG